MARGSRRPVHNIPRRVKRLKVETARGVKDVFVDDASQLPSEAHHYMYSSPHKVYTPSSHFPGTPQSSRGIHSMEESREPSVISIPKLVGKVGNSNLQHVYWRLKNL